MAATSTLLADTLAFIRNTWPDIKIDEARIAEWEAELADGTGRSPEELKADILKHVVGEDRVREYVAAAFSERGLTANDERIDRITGEMMAGRQFSELNTTLDDFGTRSTAEGMMSGGTLTKIVRGGDQEDIWAMTYTVNGVQQVYTFESYEEMQAILGPNAEAEGFDSMDGTAYDAGVNDGSIWDMGSAGPLAGQEGSYATFYSDLERDAAIAAGARNPGAIKAYLEDPEIRAILAASVQGGWTKEQTQAEIRNTKYYQEVLYPGVKTLLDQGVPNPESQWWAYHDSVGDNLAMLGYEKDEDGTYRSQVGLMMEAGISDTVFNTMAPQFHRAANDEEFAAALDYWLDKTAGRDVSFDDVYDAMSGQSEGDLLLAVESATLQFQANMHNTTLTDEQISRIAAQTELSEAQIAVAFTTSEEALLALGDRGLKRYGLTEEALVSSAFGLKEGDQSAADIRKLANKTAAELGLQDDKKAQFYASFNERGALIKPGLSALRPEGG